MKRVDLRLDVNLRGTYACARACLPHLLEAESPHIRSLAPPLPLRARWFRDHTAYSIAKFGMSMCVLGMAAEFRDRGVAVNALWPRTLIDTAALNVLGDAKLRHGSRSPAIVADAAHRILTRPARECSGNFFLDEDVLAEAGVEDFDRYATDPTRPLITDLFVEPLA